VEEITLEYTSLFCEKSEGIATITLNRPKSMNALNRTLLGELGHALQEMSADEDTKVVILAGHEKFFAAGADITEVVDIASPAHAYDFSKSVDFIRRMDDFDKPILAAVSGMALGGGCELALACDLRIAAENAQFGLPEIKIGVMPGAGGTQRLPRLVGTAKAKELLYTGDFIDAAEAYRLGLVNRVVPVGSLMGEAKALATKIASRPGVAIKMIKLAVNGGLGLDLKSAIAYEARCFEILFSTEDQKEGMRAFVEKRKPAFRHR
jgi:enoyl-CoA hydratase